VSSTVGGWAPPVHDFGVGLGTRPVGEDCSDTGSQFADDSVPSSAAWTTVEVSMYCLPVLASRNSESNHVSRCGMP